MRANPEGFNVKLCSAVVAILNMELVPKPQITIKYTNVVQNGDHQWKMHAKAILFNIGLAISQKKCSDH